MASVLSLAVMSGLKTFHKSRLQSKQRLTKRRKESLALTTGAGSMWSPVCWLVGFEATGFGWRGLLWLLASQPVSWSARTDQTRLPDPHHMHGVLDLLERGATCFGVLLWYNEEKCIIHNKCGLNPKHFNSFFPSAVLKIMTSQHTGSKAPWEQTRRSVSAQQDWNQPLFSDFPPNSYVLW